MTLFIHEVKKTEDFFLTDGTIPDPIFTDNVDFNIFQSIIKSELQGGETDKWNKIVNACMGSLKDYWGYILNALTQMEDDVKGRRPDLIVDDWVT